MDVTLVESDDEYLMDVAESSDDGYVVCGYLEFIGLCLPSMLRGLVILKHNNFYCSCQTQYNFHWQL